MVSRRFFALLVFAIVLTSGASVLADGKSSSSSKSATGDKNILFQVSGGTSQLDQYIANDHLEHPPAMMVAGRYHKSAFDLGVCYLALYHKDATGANPPGQTPNTNEIDATEQFSLTSLCGGLLIGDMFMLDAGYGYAYFSRSQNQPNALTTQSTTVNASGTGWMAGGSLIPLHLGGNVSLGATAYYFDATASDYSSDTINGTTETIKTSGNGSVHSFGWYGGISIFIGI